MSINWASTEHGARLIDVSSDVVGCEAKHVLDSSPETKWFTGERYRDESASHWVCLSLTHTPPDLAIRTVGWHCASAYSSNPHTVFLHVSSDGINFKAWDRFVCPRQLKGASLFICSAPISTDIYPYLCFEVTKTFGDHQKEGLENVVGSGAANGGRGTRLPTSSGRGRGDSPPQPQPQHATVSSPSTASFATKGTYMNRIFCYSDEIPTSPLTSLHRSRATATVNGSVSRRPLAASPLPLSPMPVSLSNHSSFCSPVVRLSSGMDRRASRPGRARLGTRTGGDTTTNKGAASGYDLLREGSSYVLPGSTKARISSEAIVAESTADDTECAAADVDDGNDDGGSDDEEHDDDSLDHPSCEVTPGDCSGTGGGGGNANDDGGDSTDAGTCTDSASSAGLTAPRALLNVGDADRDRLSAFHSALGLCVDEGDDVQGVYRGDGNEGMLSVRAPLSDSLSSGEDVVTHIQRESLYSGAGDDSDDQEKDESGDLKCRLVGGAVRGVTEFVEVDVRPLDGGETGVCEVTEGCGNAGETGERRGEARWRGAPSGEQRASPVATTGDAILRVDGPPPPEGCEGNEDVEGERQQGRGIGDNDNALLLRERVRTLEDQLAALLARLPVEAAGETGPEADEHSAPSAHRAPPSLPPPLLVSLVTSTTLDPATSSASARDLAPVVGYFDDDVVALATLLHRKLRLRLLKQVQLNLLLSSSSQQ